MKNLKEKPMGQAIRNYFPKAFVLHRDVMFRVDGPGQSLPGITPDIDLSREIMKKMMREPGLEQKAWKKILYELNVYGFDVDRIKEQMEFDGELDDDLARLITPVACDDADAARCGVRDLDVLAVTHCFIHLFVDFMMPRHLRGRSARRNRERARTAARSATGR